MNLKVKLLTVVAGFTLAVLACSGSTSRSSSQDQSSGVEPKVVVPGPVGRPPSDAVILFDGKDLSKWKDKDGGPAKWQVKHGVMTVTKTGNISTRQDFGDMQLHVEWASPAEVKGEGQGRGNSGVYLQDRYEVQVLDSYQNPTYFNGQAGSIYKQYAPLVNASRKPGEWQAYDIIYHAPVFADDGTVTRKGRVTVLHNGVLIQDNVEIQGSTSHDQAPIYTKHGNAPITLQDHGDPVRYRNIWVRPL